MPELLFAGYQLIADMINIVKAEAASNNLAILISKAVAILVLMTAVSNTQAYDGVRASEYANQFAIHRNKFWMNFKNDCTNFVSQAFYAGGINFRGDTAGWHQYPSLGEYTKTWTVARYNYAWVKRYLASKSSSLKWNKAGRYTPAWHVRGDPVYYDFNSNGTIDHMSLMVGTGTDPGYPGWTGNVVDEHSTNRKRVVWHLKPYNSKWQSTTYYFLHIRSDAR